MRYKVIRGIAYDKTGERFNPGDVADLSKWPKRVLKRWLERGVIEPVEDKPKRKTSRTRKAK